MINISIIIPHYNTPMYLEKLLDSIPKKDDIQIIVVDDNSTENIQLLENVKMKYSKYVEFYTNNTGIQSAGACRNMGLNYANGKWVAFADADDYFLPEMYEYVSKYFDTDNDLVIFNPTSIFIDTGEPADRHIIDRQRIENYLKNPTYENLLKVERMSVPWTKIIKKSIIDKNNIVFSTTRHHNDILFVCKLHFYCKKVAISPQIIYCATRNKGSLTTKVNINAYNMHVDEYIKAYIFMKEHYSKKDFDVLGRNGAILLYEAFQRKLGWKTIIATYRKLRKNKVSIFSKNMKNPKYLINAIKDSNKIVKRERQYYV